MKRKALLCAMLALALLCSTQPAAALISNQRAIVISGEARLPAIEVVVPSSAAVMINPYMMPVQVGTLETDEQIICYPEYLLSLSEVPIKVDVKVRGSAYSNSDLTLAAAPTGGTGSAKRVFAYFEIQQSDAIYCDEVQWDAGYNASKHIRVSETEQSKEGMVTLPPLTLEHELPEKAYAWFRVAGDATRNPTQEWNENDGISVTVVYKFTPLPYSSNSNP